MFRQRIRLTLCAAGCVLLFGAPAAPQSREGDSQKKDEPPRCESLPEEKRRQTEACKTEEEKREDAYEKLLQERADREKPKHSSFLQWLHFDGLWLPAQTGAIYYGLIGAHMTIADIKGANIFGPPGVMLLLEDHSGRRRVRPALTWGVSLHLTDFRTPGSSRPAQLYLNFTKAWTSGSYESGLALAGLSLTFKEKK